MPRRSLLVEDLQKLAAADKAALGATKETTMEEDPRESISDRKLISLEQDHEVRYWTGAFNCTERELRAAMEVVGNSAKWVREYLRRAAQSE